MEMNKDSIEECEQLQNPHPKRENNIKQNKQTNSARNIYWKD